ncbi:MAG TPA: trypco2 family protein [Trebonia sp.]|nr:trypco2 family protein [Trebonia sp.]
MKRIGVAAALSSLRDELGEAQDEGREHQFRFEIIEAEVEFLLEVAAEGDSEAKADIWVASVGASGKVSRSDTHRLRLKLAIADSATGGRNLEVGRRDTRPWDDE